jgi:hypothetical protein
LRIERVVEILGPELHQLLHERKPGRGALGRAFARRAQKHVHDVVAVQRFRSVVLLRPELGDDEGRAGDVGDLGHVNPRSSVDAREFARGGREWPKRQKKLFLG